jgi:hypothetical protein
MGKVSIPWRQAVRHEGLFPRTVYRTCAQINGGALDGPWRDWPIGGPACRPVYALPNMLCLAPLGVVRVNPGGWFSIICWQAPAWVVSKETLFSEYAEAMEKPGGEAIFRCL